MYYLFALIVVLTSGLIRSDDEIRIYYSTYSGEMFDFVVLDNTGKLVLTFYLHDKVIYSLDHTYREKDYDDQLAFRFNLMNIKHELGFKQELLYLNEVFQDMSPYKKYIELYEPIMKDIETNYAPYVDHVKLVPDENGIYKPVYVTYLFTTIVFYMQGLLTYCFYN